MSGLQRWPSWPRLTFDIIAQGREATGRPPVPAGLHYDPELTPFYLIQILEAPSTRLEAYPLIEVETIATTYAEAERLAYDVDEIMMGYPLSTSSGGRVVLVDRVEVVSSPVELDIEGESSIRRFLATYQPTVRRG